MFLDDIIFVGTLAVQNGNLIQRAGMDKGPIQVPIIEDEAMIRKGVAALLKGDEEIKVTGEAANAFRAIERHEGTKPEW